MGVLVWKCLLTATWLCDLPATLSLSSRSLGLEPWSGGRASVGTLWDQTRVPPSHPLFHLSTVFLSHQLPSPCSGRAAGGVCSPPPCATEHTGFLRAAWQEGLPEGKGRQQGSDPAEGSCFQSTIMMEVVVVEPLLGSSYQTQAPHMHSLI